MEGCCALQVWGLQDPYRIQPAEYIFSDTLRVEVSGGNSLFSVQSVDLLSEIWLPRREDWLMEKIHIPKLMTGPVKEDSLDQVNDGTLVCEKERI